MISSTAQLGKASNRKAAGSMDSPALPEMVSGHNGEGRGAGALGTVTSDRPSSDRKPSVPTWSLQRSVAPAPPTTPASGRQPRKGNPLGHTAKEKMRRASIVNSCNAFRPLLPLANSADADKATIFRLSVEYLAFLR